MKYILIIAIISLASCRTVKNSATVETRYDSTWLKQRDSVIEVKRLDSAAYVNMIESLSENTIIFQDTGKTIIEFYPDGNLKTVEGNLKTVRSLLSKEQNTSAYYKSRYDSLAATQNKDQGQVQKKTVTITKTKKVTVFPWYFWLLLIPAALVGYYIKKRFV